MSWVWGYPFLVLSVLEVEQWQGWAWAIGMGWWCYGPKGNHNVTWGRAWFGQEPDLSTDTIEIYWLWLWRKSRAFKNRTPGKASFTLAPECYVTLSTVSWDGYPADTALKSTTPGICFVFSRVFFFLANKSNSETKTPVKQSLIKQNSLKYAWKLNGNILAINILKYFSNFQKYWFQPYNCIQCKTRNKMSK